MTAQVKNRWDIFGQASDLENTKEILLKKRGFNSVEEAAAFLECGNPLNYLREFSAELKIGLKKAKTLVKEATLEDRPIIIHGDYDADGICAVSILYNFLTKEKGYKKTYYFVPNRFEHGYGISKDSVDASLQQIREDGVNPENVLFISVDSGITSVEEVDYIKKLGHEIVITDHHQKPKTLPQADVLVWSDKVVGATLAWILARVLGSKDKKSIAFAALATVTDVYELIGMNRALVKRGLKIINHNPPSGLKELIQISGIESKDLGTYELGWVLGPRINASGRLADASWGVRLFTETDFRIVYSLAEELNALNLQRQEETARMYDLIEDFVKPPKYILTAHEDFHEGLIGLVASRLVRKYYRPSLVLSIDGTEAKGSARSIEGINIIEILREFSDLFVNLGGHPMAAGFTISVENISVLEEKLGEAFKSRFEDEIFVPSLDIDAEITLELLDWPLFNFIETLKPFGVGNHSPLFVTRNLGVANIDFVGREKNHVSLKLFDGNRYLKAIHFGAREKYSGVTLGSHLDVVYEIKENNFRGRQSLDLIVRDFKFSV